MRAVLAATAVFIAFSFFGVLAEDTPAQPKQKDAPDYPISCEPADGAAPQTHSVDVSYSINRDGLTENVSILDSTDPCFEEAALSAVRGWVFEPRRVNGRAMAQTGMTAQLLFVPVNDEPASVIEAKPVTRVPPEYPGKCFAGAADEEFVVVKFEVSREGNVDNVEVLETTNSCFNEAAIDSVKEWKFRPKTVDGSPTRQLGAVTQLKFQLQDRTPPEDRVREIVSRRLNQARLQLKGGRPERALKTLQDFEARYGDSLSRKELAEFHRVRGYVRIKLKDYEGALDDFRSAKRLGSGDSLSAVEKRITLLEELLENEPSGSNEQSDEMESGE